MTDRITNAERTRKFGKPCTPANNRLYTTPWGIRVQAHKLIAARFAAACVVAHRESRWQPKRIDSYNCRTIRGSTDAYSTHAWALSWDFFATPPNVPPPGGVWTPDNPPDAKFVAAFTELGFTWGGTFGRKDTPHIEWSSAPPGSAPAPTTPKEVATMFPNHRFVRIEGEAMKFYSWDPSECSVFAWNGAPGPILSSKGQAKAKAAGGIRDLAWVPGVGLSAVVGNPGASATWPVWNFKDLSAEDRA